MTNGAVTGRKIVKKSGLISGPALAAPAVRDIAAAAARMPSFDFLKSQPAETGPSGVVAPVALDALPLAAQATEIVGVEEAIVSIPVELLDDSPYQPRIRYNPDRLAELAETLKVRQLDPVIVRRKGERFELISGHRRKRAAPLAGLATLLARIVVATDDQARVAVLAANEPREDFTDYERALAYESALTGGREIRTHRDLARCIGIDHSLVTRRLSMLRLPEPVQSVLREYPDAFTCKWVPRLLALTDRPYDALLLQDVLRRVATGSIQISAIFSLMSTKEVDSGPARSGLTLNRGNKLFAQVTPNAKRRQVVVKIPGECNIEDAAKAILDALAHLRQDDGVGGAAST